MSNFGVGFHNLLVRISYPGIEQYEPYNFDWFVYQPGLEPFLTWLIDHLSEENILTDDELTKYAALNNEVIENDDERQKLLDVLVSLDNGKMIIPWTNYQRTLAEQYTCVKAQTQALKSQLNSKQQQYKALLMKGPKAKEKVRETRRQIEQLLTLSSPSSLMNLIQTTNSNHFQNLGINFVQMERNYLVRLQNIWTDDTVVEQNPNSDMIAQLSNRTMKLVRLETEAALANVEFETLKSQIQLCTQLKKYFDSTPLDDLKKLVDRLGSKSVLHAQQRTQLESQLHSAYTTRHERSLGTLYSDVLQRQLFLDSQLALKQQSIAESLVQHTHFCTLFDGLLEQRLALIDQTSQCMTKVTNYTKTMLDSARLYIAPAKKQTETDANIDLTITTGNLIERMKQMEIDLSKNNSTVSSFLDYINRQENDFRPPANGLSKELDNSIKERKDEWKQLLTMIGR